MTMEPVDLVVLHEHVAPMAPATHRQEMDLRQARNSSFLKCGRPSGSRQQISPSSTIELRFEDEVGMIEWFRDAEAPHGWSEA
jgi:hypothetical protein